MTGRVTTIPNFNAPAIRRCLSEMVWPLARLREVSAELGFPMRMIGGLPREFMLAHLHGHPLPAASLQDMDIVMEGDARTAGEALQRRWGGELKVHAAFQTATWRVPAATSRLAGIDLITARSETYPQPGALPAITPGTFADDAARRDFTVNTLALDLATCLALADGQSEARLHHHPRALADLAAGRVRVLHDASFHDDPTRILRAVKYAQRYGYAIEPHSLARLRREVATGGLDNLSPVRVRHEFQRIFRETNMTSVLQRLEELQVLASLDMGMRNWPVVRAALARAAGEAGDRERVLWILLLFQGDGGAERERLGLSRKTVKEIAQFRALRRHEALPRLASLSPSQAVQILDGMPIAVLRALSAWQPGLKKTVDQYRAVWRDRRSRLSGHDLVAMGYGPGPELGHALRRLRAACLDGEATTRAEEMNLVRQLLGDPPASVAP